MQGMWVEVKIRLGFEEYENLRLRAVHLSKSVPELVKDLILNYLKS